MKILLYISLYIGFELLFNFNYLNIHKIDNTFNEHICTPMKTGENYYVFSNGNCSNGFYLRENYITSQPCWIKYEKDICYISLKQPLLVDNVLLIFIIPILILLITLEIVKY